MQLGFNVAETYNNRGNAYLKLGDCQKAIADYDEAIKLGFEQGIPNREIAQGVLAEIKRKQKEAEAKARIEEAERRKREEEEERRRKEREFEFTTVTVNRQGKEISRRQHRAEFFKLDLGKGVVMEMVAIPGGTFMMGSPEGEGSDREHPQHKVTVKPFFMGKYPVTQAQWKAVAVLSQFNRDLKSNPAHFKGDNRPVENVSWYEAVEFCQRISRLGKGEFRLPSEAEWEYSCRAGTNTPFYFGETLTDKLANYDANDTFAKESKGKYRQKTTPVGKFPPNAFGLYDMHGNVWEWCLDDWHSDYVGAPTDGSAWLSGDYYITKVIRGGSWGNYPWFCRSSFRLNVNYRDGFRVVCVPPRIS
ncbi:MAG: SUMF1/EgtB/PvdO family nonheme iron enzyme [Moorea sp. SIO2B7]|nr:SUMF1/EgtB/PvdO family nonheme iron enzyme [Moorena sp. SIO2B7]